MTADRAVAVERELYFRDIVEEAVIAAKPLEAHAQGLTGAKGITQSAQRSGLDSFGDMNP